MNLTFKSNASAIISQLGDTRTPREIEEDFRLERRLSDQLRAAGPDERPALYLSAYEEYFQTIALRRGMEPTSSRVTEKNRIRLKALKRHLRPDMRFLEVGSGDAAFLFEVAPYVGHVCALDVQDVHVNYSVAPANFTFLKAEGISAPLPDNSVDFVFSDQFLEHLHPDDTQAHLREVFRLLVSGGRYKCITPSRVSGPHDDSIYFDDVATGFHLKEYDSESIVKAFREAGFPKVTLFASGGGRELPLPYWVARLVDSSLLALPQELRRKLRRFKVFRGLVGLCVEGEKGCIPDLPTVGR